MNEVLDFIKRRFSENNSNWTCGNCYYFAVILKDRFPKGRIVYDVIDGHFYLYLNNKFYDYRGEHNLKLSGKLILWSDIDIYDKNVGDRVRRDCLF